MIGPGCVIGEDCVVGAGSELIARVTLVTRVRLGARCLLHPGAVLGADGFGLAMDGGHWIKVPQLGGVVLGNDCEIGANTTIDRGAIEDTCWRRLAPGHRSRLSTPASARTPRWPGFGGRRGGARIRQLLLIGGASASWATSKSATRVTRRDSGHQSIPNRRYSPERRCGQSQLARTPPVSSSSTALPGACLHPHEYPPGGRTGPAFAGASGHGPGDHFRAPRQAVHHWAPCSGTVAWTALPVRRRNTK